MDDFTNRYSALYDKIGEPVIVKQKRESVSALFIVLFLLGIVLLAYPYLGNA